MLQAYNAGLVVSGSFPKIRIKGANYDLPEVPAEVFRSADEVYMRLIKYRSDYGGQLPEDASCRLAEMINELLSRYPTSRERGFKPTYDQTLAFVMSLAAFRSEFSLLLADTEAAVRSLVDRAFLHLQRSIIADDSIAARWRQAFSAGETTCEKLGAVHLLWFGIYAFKAHAAGERTDLVLGDSIILSEAERSADALVLTERKKVLSAVDLEVKAKEAFEQARLYGFGSLAGFELATRRYLVMVSEGRCAMPEDRMEGSVTYEFRNIAVSPRPPSQEASTSRRQRR